MAIAKGNQDRSRGQWPKAPLLWTRPDRAMTRCAVRHTVRQIGKKRRHFRGNARLAIGELNFFNIVFARLVNDRKFCANIFRQACNGLNRRFRKRSLRPDCRRKMRSLNECDQCPGRLAPAQARPPHRAKGCRLQSMRTPCRAFFQKWERRER